MVEFGEKRNLVLIGYRGSGKTSVARKLAQRMGHQLVTTDVRIIEIAGYSIPEIVEHYGWNYFRELELDVVEDYSNKQGLVIDTGGGVPVNPVNIENLKKNGVVVWLQASVESVVERISKGSDRPPLVEGKTHVEEVQEVLAERTPIYQSASDFSVLTDGKDLDEVVDEILEFLGIEAERL